MDGKQSWQFFPKKGGTVNISLAYIIVKRKTFVSETIQNI